MNSSESIFTQRQYMVSPDFELFHNRDEPNLDIAFHNHDFYEVYFFISGKVNYIIEGKSYILKPDDILIINNKEIHRPFIEPGSIYERVVLWINPDFITSRSTDSTNLSMCFESSLKSNYNLLRPGPDMLYAIKNILNKLKAVCSNISFGSNILKELYLTELIVFLNKAYLETSEEDIEKDIIYDKKTSEIIQYINRNIDGDLSLDSISSRFYTSKYHLIREFKKHTGNTIYSFIYQKRLLTAKTFLRQGYSVTDVCQMCGFKDYSNFIRAFRKNFGRAPKEYAKTLKK